MCGLLLMNFQLSTIKKLSPSKFLSMERLNGNHKHIIYNLFYDTNMYSRRINKWCTKKKKKKNKHTGSIETINYIINK